MKKLFKQKKNQISNLSADLDLLMRVFAGFAMVDDELHEDEIDSTLSQIRYDYPIPIYEDLKKIYIQALNEKQDLNTFAITLSSTLSLEEKILLAVQVFVLLSKAPNRKKHLLSYYQFTSNLGIGSEANDLISQLDRESLLNDSNCEISDNSINRLEMISFGRENADLCLDTIPHETSSVAYRFKDLILLKNSGTKPIIVRGRTVKPNEFCRIYRGHRFIIGEAVFSYEELVQYFETKKSARQTKLYLGETDSGSYQISKERGKLSLLEIRLGLVNEIKGLKENSLLVDGKKIEIGHIRKAGIASLIQSPNRNPVSLSTILKRGSGIAEQFNLITSKSVYEISNIEENQEDVDIYLSPGLDGVVNLKIDCDYDNKSGVLEIIESDYPIYVENQLIRRTSSFLSGDNINIGRNRVLHCNLEEGIIEEHIDVVKKLEVKDLNLTLNEQIEILQGVTFSAQRGEMIGVLGPSGCGKSSLLRALAGQQKCQSGSIEINGIELYENLKVLRPLIAFMPHDEAIDPFLTVRENLEVSATVRCPHLSSEEIKRRVETKAKELGLTESLDRITGDSTSRTLSGGQRKRLNLALDMISYSDIFLFDEPTSGLSSKDSEHVLEIVRSLADNHITIVSIHQPSEKLVQLFDKVLLLDMGGMPAFYGSPHDMLFYFSEAKLDLENTPEDTDYKLKQVDEVFDILEKPLRDPSGEAIYEADSKGKVSLVRRFTPQFWRDRFQTYQFKKEISSPDLDLKGNSIEKIDARSAMPPRDKLDNFKVFWGLLKRSFLSKVRSKANIITTLLAAPGLALLISIVLHYSEEGEFTFASAFHLPTYLFLSLVVSLFLGLTNSVDDIIRDRSILYRERNHRLPIFYYIVSKFATLVFFSVIQVALYLLVGNSILQIEGMFFHHLLWMALTAFCGVSVGLLISSIVKEGKVATNLIPLILIPNIILAGALIRYEEMNRDLGFLYSIRKWVSNEGDDTDIIAPSRLRVPFVGQFMPLRWSYESIVIAQNESNEVAKSQKKFTDAIRSIINTDAQELSEADSDRLYVAKEGLSKVSGLHALDKKSVIKKLKMLNRQFDQGHFDPENEEWSAFDNEMKSADEIYLNRKLQMLVEKAEIERQGSNSGNVFFGLYKKWLPDFLTTKVLEKETSSLVETRKLNFFALLIFVFVPLVLLWLNLRRQLRRA